MHFDIRFGTLLHEKADASRLIARKILIDHAPARQYQWKFFIGNFFGRVELNRMKLRLTVGVIEAILKQTRRAWMIFGGARPEDAVVLFDLLPRYAVVVSVAAARSDTKLVEDL